MNLGNCPHCEHDWDEHSWKRCPCGCMWKPPAPPPPPQPTARDQLIDNIENTIWTALEHQAENGPFGGPYIDREMDMVDASGAGLDMHAVAAAVAELFINSQRRLLLMPQPNRHRRLENPLGEPE
jgi:hypothetical protein